MAIEMNKKIKNVISFIIFLILLFSVINTLTTSVSALGSLVGKVYECNSVIQLEADKNATENPFLPIDRILTIPVDVNYMITGGFSEVVAEMYQQYEYHNFLHLFIDETPEWCSASFLPPVMVVPITSSFMTHDANLIVQVNENAPAFGEGTIKVRIEVGRLGAVLNATFYQDIPFSPGYLPNIGITTQKNLQIIGPQDTANFKIDLENFGNAKTNVKCKIVDKPAGWFITIDSNTIIDVGDNPTKTIFLDVKPSDDFGYHDEREVITVSITPSYFNEESLTGEEFFVSFIVQNRGFSTPGFEIAIVFLAFSCILFLSKNKTKFNQKSKKRNERRKNQ